MGSLFSSPKPLPSAQPQAIRVTPVPAASSAATDSDVQSGSSLSADSEQAASTSEQREQNLLKRDRGVFGTVQTGFRGFLAPAQQQQARKSLLGE